MKRGLGIFFSFGGEGKGRHGSWGLGGAGARDLWIGNSAVGNPLRKLRFTSADF